MEKISEELLKRLDLLAQKLGVTIEHLWQVLVRQAYVEAYFAIFSIISSVVLVTVACRYIVKTIDIAVEDNYDKRLSGRIVLSFVLGILAVICLLTALFQYSNLGYLFNPEFYALEQVRILLGGAR